MRFGGVKKNGVGVGKEGLTILGGKGPGAEGGGRGKVNLPLEGKVVFFLELYP